MKWFRVDIEITTCIVLINKILGEMRADYVREAYWHVFNKSYGKRSPYLPDIIFFARAAV